MPHGRGTAGSQLLLLLTLLLVGRHGLAAGVDPAPPGPDGAGQAQRRLQDAIGGDSCAGVSCTVCLDPENGRCHTGGGHDSEEECLTHSGHEWCGVGSHQFGDPCDGGLALTAPTAVRFPNRGRYSNNQDCSWFFTCDSGRPYLTFSSFQTESNFDFVHVYGAEEAHTLSKLVEPTAGSRAPNVLRSSDAALLLRFTTDGSVQRNGWEVTVECDDSEACPEETPCSHNTDGTCSAYTYDQGTADVHNGGSRCSPGTTAPTESLGTFYAPAAPCSNLPLFGEYEGQTCEEYEGDQLTVLDTLFQGDPQERCAIDAFLESCCYCGQLTIEDSCGVAVDLNEESSPVSGTLIGQGDAFTLACASGEDGPERVYSLDVPAGYNLQIGMSENDFDSRHELRFGGDCPGTELVQCIDDPDDTEMSFQNDGEDNQVVFFVVGAYSSPGGFTVAWELTPLRGEVREVSFPDADADATLVNVEVHIRTTSWANEISWNIDGIGDLTFDGLADRQDYYVSPVQTL